MLFAKKIWTQKSIGRNLKKKCFKFLIIILIIVGDEVWILKAYVPKINKLPKNTTEKEKKAQEKEIEIAKKQSEIPKITTKKPAMKARIIKVPINGTIIFRFE